MIYVTTFEHTNILLESVCRILQYLPPPKKIQTSFILGIYMIYMATFKNKKYFVGEYL